MATPIEATPIEACQMEFSALSKLQLENHVSNKSDIDSLFAGAIVKRTWYATFLHKMESEVQNDKIKFKVLHTPHYLARVYVTQKLPALRVKQKWIENDEVQICWSHNAGNNVNRKGEMVIGSSNNIQTIDSKWMDDYIQLMVENGNEKFINDCQGNHPFLEQWNTYLPRYTLTPIQPYFFESDTESAFPIHRIHHQTDISFKYTRFTNFREMLRMRKKYQGVWKEIAFNKTYIEGNYGKDELPLPEMWGIYFIVSKAEIESIPLDETGRPVEVFEQIIDDVIEIGTEGSYTYADFPPSIEVQTGHPCRLITMKAENSDFAKKRNYSNYTTNVNVYDGWSPIKKLTSFKYGPNTKMANIKSPHISRMLPYYHCPRVPYERGYNIIPFSSKLSDYNFDSGVIMSNLNVKLQLQLGDTNPMITAVKIYKEDTDKIEDEVLDDVSPKSREKEKENEKELDGIGATSYKIIVRALVSKTLVYSKAQDGKHYNVFFKKHEVTKK